MRKELRVTQIERPVGRSGSSSGPELRPRFMWMSEVEVDAACVWPLHHHAHYEVIVVRQGRYRCRVDASEIELGPGEAVVIRPGDRHEDYLATSLSYAAINLSLPGAGDRRSADLFRATAPVEARRLTAASDDWIALADRCASELGRTSPTAAILDTLSAELLRRVLRAVPPAILDPAWVREADDAFLARLQAAFAAHQGGTVPVAVLAHACGLSERAFTSRCRSATGLPPAKALLRHRCEQAVRLLHEGLSVTATAERLGFASQFHFSRVFKRHLGEPPSRLH